MHDKLHWSYKSCRGHMHVTSPPNNVMCCDFLNNSFLLNFLLFFLIMRNVFCIFHSNRVRQGLTVDSILIWLQIRWKVTFAVCSASLTSIKCKNPLHRSARKCTNEVLFYRLIDCQRASNNTFWCTTITCGFTCPLHDRS